MGNVPFVLEKSARLFLFLVLPTHSTTLLVMLELSVSERGVGGFPSPTTVLGSVVTYCFLSSEAMWGFFGFLKNIYLIYLFGCTGS